MPERFPLLPLRIVAPEKLRRIQTSTLAIAKIAEDAKPKFRILHRQLAEACGNELGAVGSMLRTQLFPSFSLKNNIFQSGE